MLTESKKFHDESLVIGIKGIMMAKNKEIILFNNPVSTTLKRISARDFYFPGHINFVSSVKHF
jgi:hypothetical protein